jgi:hypothetical protein
MAAPENDLVPVGTYGPPRRPFSWRTALIFAFVAFQIFIIAFRNPLDLWWRPMEKWGKEQSWWDEAEPYYRFVDRWTERYERGLGVDQGWAMFTPPLARAAPFLTTRLEFADGTTESLNSANEPGEEFFRVGGWRMRKLEDRLAFGHPNTLGNDPEVILWETYVRVRVREWREANPNDDRTLTRVSLFRRRVPLPSHDPAAPAEDVETYLVGEFDPDGKLR